MRLGWLALLCVIASACSIGSSSGLPDDDDSYTMAPNASVVRVVDGDTLVVDIDGVEERVRLIGIDTPESVAPDRPVECYGKEASERMEELVPPGTPIHLARDIEARDQYERLLAYVYRADDGLHVNLDQVVGGYAEASSYPPNTALQPEFDHAQRQAREADAGLWGACGGPDVPIGPPPG
jgi:micrococcal nuclease